MTLMNDLAYLGAALGFSAIEIYNAYIEKIKSIMIVRHPVTKREAEWWGKLLFGQKKR